MYLFLSIPEISLRDVILFCKNIFTEGSYKSKAIIRLQQFLPGVEI